MLGVRKVKIKYIGRCKYLFVGVSLLTANTIARADVTLYGVLDVSVDQLRTTGSTSDDESKNTTAMTSNISVIGMQGSQAISSDLKAIFQVQGLVGINNGSGSGLATRESWVGLSSAKYGTIKLGRDDTPLKLSTIGLDPFGDAWFGGVASYDNIIGSSYGTGGGGGYPWDLVTNNAIEYKTPALYGFSAAAFLGFSNSSVAKQVSVFSGSFSYDSAVLHLSYAYEQHNGQTPGRFVGFTITGTSSKDTDHRVGAGYTFGGAQLSGVVERIKYTQNGSASLAHTAFMLGGRYAMGSGTFRASYSRAFSATGAPDTGAQQWAIGYGYDLSKRTELFAAAAYVQNQAAANYNPLTFALDGYSTPIGANVSMVSVGIHHSF
jgi:predicted porin